MRAAVTHFDGDPLVIDFWLLLYEKYWRGEVHKVYADVCYDPGLVTPDLLEREKKSFKRFKEINVEFIPEVHPPEWSNPRLIKKVKEEMLFLIESDGWLFGKGIVDKYCIPVETNVCDMVCSPYRLFPEAYDELLGYSGFMRNMMFIKTDYLRSVELDFYPRNVEGQDFDCFGYISLQLAKKKPRMLGIPTNFVEDPQANDLRNYPWIHIRQMNSSILGFGNAGSGIFKGFREGNETKIQEVRGEAMANVTMMWMYYKAVAMRYLMIYALRDFSPFAEEYKKTLKKVIDSLGMDWDKVQGIVTLYRTLMNV
jgi:hypothetical protein